MSKTTRLAGPRSVKTVHRQDEAAPQAVQAAPSERHHKSRRKSLRRRQIDPTTCERDYSSEELEFMRALDTYKKSSGRLFPTCSEILEVLRSLGYERPVRTECNAVTAQ